MKLTEWCLGVAVALASTNASYGRGEGVQVAIQGMPGTEFSASWRLTPAEGGPARDGHWEGVVPQEYDLPAGQLDLTLTQLSATGHLAVTVVAGGNRSHSQTQGVGSRISMSIR